MSTRRRITDSLENSLARMALSANRRPVLTLLLVSMTAAASIAAASQLRLNAELTQLLPTSFESVQGLEAVRQRFGGIGWVAVVGTGAEPAVLRRFADDIAPRLEAAPTVRYVDATRPARFFEERALYFLELEDLQRVEEQVTTRVDYERSKRNPLLIDLEDAPPPSLDFAWLKDKYASGSSGTGWMQKQLGETYFIDEQAGLIALLARPVGMSIDLDFSQRVVEDVRAVIAGMDLTPYGENFRVELTGAYTKRTDQQTLIRGDLALSTVIAVFVILLFLALHFRRLSAAALVFAPLAVGLAWTLGVASIAVASLNILTGFLGAILLGLGVDHGIHLLGRFESEWNEVGDCSVAMDRTFRGTGRAVTVAAITTTVAFAGVATSEFRAFREFGLLAAFGMMLVVLAYTVTLPAMLGLLYRRGWRPHRRRATGTSRLVRALTRHPGLGLTASAAVLLILAAASTGVRFDYDFGSLDSGELRSYVLDRKVNLLLGYSQAPVFVLTRDAAEERAVALALREQQRRHGENSTIDFVAAGSDLIPADQAQKHEVLGRLGATLARLKARWLPRQARPMFTRVRKMTHAEPFNGETLPPEVRRRFWGGRDAGEAGFVLAFPAITLSDGAQVSQFASEVRDGIQRSGQNVMAAGEALILADILAMVSHEAPPVLVVTLLLVFLTLWLLLGSWRLALLCLVPPAATLVGLFGLLSLVGLQLNYLTIVLVPVLFGVSVDGGVHLATRWTGVGATTASFSETGRSVAGALLTTGLGFAALLVADHHGLDTLGQTAVLGLALNLLVCLVLMPALLMLLPTVRPSTSTVQTAGSLQCDAGTSRS